MSSQYDDEGDEGDEDYEDYPDNITDLAGGMDEDQLQRFDGPIAAYKKLKVSGDPNSEIYSIETAPVDGTEIFVADHEMLVKAHWISAIAKDDYGNLVGAWRNTELGFAWMHDEEHGPTHWWPLAFMSQPSNYIN